MRFSILSTLFLTIGCGAQLNSQSNTFSQTNYGEEFACDSNVVNALEENPVYQVSNTDLHLSVNSVSTTLQIRLKGKLTASTEVSSSPTTIPLAPLTIRSDNAGDGILYRYNINLNGSNIFATQSISGFGVLADKIELLFNLSSLGLSYTHTVYHIGSRPEVSEMFFVQCRRTEN